jgi:hypothetical protein
MARILRTERKDMNTNTSWTAEQEVNGDDLNLVAYAGLSPETECGVQTYPPGEGTGRLVAYPEIVWTRQEDGTYVKSGVIPEEETHVKTFWDDGEVRGGNVARPVAQAVALIESLIQAGGCRMPAYILRACNPPKSIAEKIEETVYPPWRSDLLAWFKENKHNSENLLRRLCPGLAEEQLQRRIQKLEYSRAKYLAKHGTDILDVKGFDNPWTVIHLAEGGETIEELQTMIAALGVRKRGRPKLVPFEVRKSRKRRRETRRKWAAASRASHKLSGVVQ